MAFRQTIAAKILGLAVFLLMLTIGLAGFLLWEVARTERHLRIVARSDIPLTEAISRLHEFGLERRLSFERWFGALNSDTPDQEVLTQAKDDYARLSKRLAEAFAKTHALIDSYPADMAARPGLVQVKTLLGQIEPMYPTISARQREALDLQLAGKHEEAAKFADVLDDLQLEVQNQRELLQETMAQLSEDSASDTERRQKAVLWLAVAATLSTAFLGLSVAALITARLTRPVKSLVAAMRDVQTGNLNVELPVRSTDEVGVLTGSFNYFVQELRSKEQIKKTFGKYVDPRIMEQILQAPDAALATGSRTIMTVLFADLVGFTSLSERLTPSLMVKLLNRHFGLQAQAIQNHHGVVDKIFGDSVMAFWGPPFVRPEEHALLACRAARAQNEALKVLLTELPELTGLRKDTPALDLRIGICSGEVVVGNIGSENTSSYTVIGDTVNLTARLEGANRIYGTQTLIGETTAQAIGDEFETREIDAIAVKGKTEPTRAFELLGAAGSVPDTLLRLRERYEQGLSAYRAQDWDQAESRFRECLQMRPEDGPSKTLLARVQTLRHSPPGPGWNGVWQLAEK